MANPVAHEVAYGAWRKLAIGPPSKILAIKCARSINALARWAKFNAKTATEEVRKIEEEIKSMQSLEASRPLDIQELQVLRQLVVNYNEIQTKLEYWWWQRAKKDWVKYGDRNTAFFNAAATQRKHENKIISIAHGDEIITDQKLIEQEMINHFSDRWCKEDFTTEEGLLIPDKLVMENEAQLLLAPPSDKEIKDAVFSFRCNKAPGVDGVTHSFFTHFWAFTMTELGAAVKDFFNTGKMEATWKDTLVALIPKCSPAESPEQFRPISLCNSAYKIVAKILSNRMKPILCRLISEEQAAFIPGRLLSDNTALAHEILHRMNTSESKVGHMAIKIDMEKAFDRIQWSFVRRAMAGFNFPPRWIDLIMECITKPRFGLLVNGVKADWINATCGLRQGCPLSPYLFILCSEYLSMLIQTSRHPGVGIKVCASAQKISHLLFADDTLLFGSASKGVALEFTRILQQYCSLSGGAVNAGKSDILFSRRVQLSAKDDILQILGHKDVKGIDYLGIKLRPGKLWAPDFNNILNKIYAQIRCWGTRHLSLAGRVALINSTLAAIPLHVISNSPVPISVINKINSLLKNFLWSGQMDKHSIHYASWSEICAPKDLGGLGIKDLITWRKVIMAKTAGRVFRAENSLLARTLRSKYAGPNCFKSNRMQSKIWKLICLGGNLVERHTFKLVGNGTSTSTLNDKWIGDMPIAKWPTFVNIAELPESVAELLDGSGGWDIQRTRAFGEPLLQLMRRLPREDAGGHDRIVWAQTEKETMDAAAIYNAECNPSSLRGGSFWKIKTQPRMLMMMWRAVNNLLPTNSWLHHHHLREDANCTWGCDQEETINHLLEDCKFITKIRNEALRMEVTWDTKNKSLLDFIQDEENYNSDSNKVIFMISILYNVWKARNCMCHGEPYMQPAAIILMALQDASYGSWTVHCSPQNFWTSPPMHWLKVNFDGSIHPNNVAGAGCIIRDYTGELVVAKGVQVASRSINMTEFRAACEGLQLAKRFFNSTSGIMIEGDSSEACTKLNRILTGTVSGAAEARVAKLLSEAPRVCITLIGRNGNKAADHLANLACYEDFEWERGMPLTQVFSNIISQDFSMV